MSKEKLPYDKSDTQSIVEYAQILVGSTLRDKISDDVEDIDDPHRKRGSFGNALEEYYFMYMPNSISEPDFPEVGMELKATPLKRLKNGDTVSKERLVITMINYMDVINETFETSHLLDKADKILLIQYMYEPDVSPLDYVIEVAALWGLPKEDMPIFKQDWETVVNKVRAGKAHEISGSDTLYLEACTKASTSADRRKQPFSDIDAKPRAWALKNSYMTAVSRGLLNKMKPLKRSRNEANFTVFELVENRFRSYYGKTEAELASLFGLLKEGARKPKNLCATITNRILGVDDDSKIEEFEKAGIKPKTIRLKANGVPKESMSFPTFDYFDVAEQPFEDSDFCEQLETKHLFVIYREDPKERETYKLSNVMFWQMPDEDLVEAEKCYDEMARRINQGHADESVKSSENKCCHVRPHARNSDDTKMTPYGVPVVKKCFWLNASYLAEQISAYLEK